MSEKDDDHPIIRGLGDALASISRGDGRVTHVRITPDNPNFETIDIRPPTAAEVERRAAYQAARVEAARLIKDVYTTLCDTRGLTMADLAIKMDRKPEDIRAMMLTEADLQDLIEFAVAVGLRFECHFARP